MVRQCTLPAEKFSKKVLILGKNFARYSKKRTNTEKILQEIEHGFRPFCCLFSFSFVLIELLLVWWILIYLLQ